MFVLGHHGRSWTRHLAAWLCLLASIGFAHAARASVLTPVERESAPLVAAPVAWSDAGFRFSLALSHGWLRSRQVRPPPAAEYGLTAEPAVRLSTAWSVVMPLRYGVFHSGLSRLRWSAALVPTWHVTPSLWIGLGAGVAGMLRSEMRHPPVVDDQTQPPGACDGVGPAAVLQARYLWLVDASFSSGPQIRADAQWVRCYQLDGQSYDESLSAAEPPVLAQEDWRFATMSIGWVLAWR